MVILCIVIMLAPLAPAPTPPMPAPTPTPAPAPTPQPTPPSPPPEPETLTYTNPEYGFSVEYPADWDVMEDFMGTIVMFAGPLVGEEELMVTINIGSEDLSESPMTLEDYLKLSKIHIKRAIEGYEEVGERSATTAGLPAIVLTYGDADMFMYSQAFFIEENVAYIITYAAPAEFHNKYLDSLELAISSFKFE